MVSNEIVSHHDWLPTFLAAAGEPDIKEKLLAGHEAGEKTFRVHLDGFNLLPYLTGARRSPRNSFFYFSDDGDLVAFRYDNWKIVFMQQRVPGTLALWGEPFVATRIPYLYNLRTDLRAGRHHVQHLLGLVHRPGLLARARTGDRGRVPEHVHRLPAPDEGRELHDRPGTARPSRRRSQAVADGRRVVTRFAPAFVLGYCGRRGPIDGWRWLDPDRGRLSPRRLNSLSPSSRAARD